MAVSGVRRLCVSASRSAAFSCSLRRAASASLARSNAASQLLIQLLDFAATLLRLNLAALGPRGELADDDRRDGKRGERHPVVEAVNEQAGRRHEVIHEREAGADRAREPRAGAPRPGDQQNSKEENRGGGAGGDRRDAPER